jgi:dTDP-4-dehydrorhamnose 3,5-epimerase
LYNVTCYRKLLSRWCAIEIVVEKTPIEDVLVVKSDVFQNERGFFTEVYRRDRFKELGLPEVFVQLNHSGSVRNVLRGLHSQWDPPMGKLMRVTRGNAFPVAVDIRNGSPTPPDGLGLRHLQRT